MIDRAENGNPLEPLENLYDDLPNENLGDILQSIANRKGEQLINHDFSVLLGATCAMIGATSFLKDSFRISEENWRVCTRVIVTKM